MQTPNSPRQPRHTYTFDSTGRILGWPGIHLARAWNRANRPCRIFPARHPVVQRARRAGEVQYITPADGLYQEGLAAYRKEQTVTPVEALRHLDNRKL